MTARAYVDAPVPLETLSDESKRQRLLLERKNVEKITFNSEFVEFYTKNNKETFGIGDSCIEIIEEGCIRVEDIQATEIIKAHTWTAECAALHINALLDQCFDKRVADMGEPCAKCRHWKECKFDWFTNLKPLFDNAGIKVSVCHPKKR